MTETQATAPIPKVIHYCWFGRGPLPASAQRCIDSWRRHFPDWQIKEWNEDNFDVNIIPYTREAYSVCKYAFVSDYARFWVLYHHGGLYFDTDVEVIRSFDDILSRGPFMGVECYLPSPSGAPEIAPGLGLGANPGLGLYEDIMSHYATLHFLKPDGARTDADTVVQITSRVMLASPGVDPSSIVRGRTFTIGGVTVYPPEFFNPYDSLTGRCRITERTHSIHWYDASWSGQSLARRRVSQWARRLLGRGFTGKIKALLQRHGTGK